MYYSISIRLISKIFGIIFALKKKKNKGCERVVFMVAFLFENRGKPTNLPKSGNSPPSLSLLSLFSRDNKLQTQNYLMEGSANERLDFGKMGYGCKHYRRRCRIRAPCCNEIYSCRHCHSEATSMLRNPFDRHELVRQDVEKVVCSVCDTEQPVAQVCTNCGVRMGEYFCNICKFFDDDTEKQQFHCDDCGICRVGGRENFFHCKKCGSCYSVGLRDNHLCVENSMRHHCPICYEYLFDSLKETIVMKCGHTMHCECYQEMIKRSKYCCPLCSKSVIDMSRMWKIIDEEIEATVMPEDYRYRKVWILCNDCNDTTKVYFHILGQRCGHCRSYNTRAIAPPLLPQ